jgi:small subunit ribosomal protein S20
VATKKRKRSALKRIRQTSRRTVTKQAGRAAARTAVRTARAAIAKGGEGAVEALAAAQSALDRAAKRGSIHRNAAARRKGRIAKAAAKRARG